MQLGLGSNQAHIHHLGQAQIVTPSHAWIGLQLKPKAPTFSTQPVHLREYYPPSTCLGRASSQAQCPSWASPSLLSTQTPSKPKASLSIWVAPSGEISTSSDVKEREGVAASRRRSCCQWDLAHRTSLQGPPAALGMQQKSSYSRHLSNEKRKFSVGRWPDWLGSRGLPRVLTNGNRGGKGLHAWLPCK